MSSTIDGTIDGPRKPAETFGERANQRQRLVKALLKQLWYDGIRGEGVKRSDRREIISVLNEVARQNLLNERMGWDMTMPARELELDLALLRMERRVRL